MNGSRYVGRVGGLAVALGIGTAIVTGCAVAAADATTTGASDTSTAGSSARTPNRTGPARTAPRKIAKNVSSAVSSTVSSAVSSTVASASASTRNALAPLRQSSAAATRSGNAAAAVTAPTASAVSSTPNPNALPPRLSIRTIGITALSTVVSGVSALASEFSIAFALIPSPPTINQSLELNGYNLVPSSTEAVTSFYGPWNYGPGGLNIVQGTQQYDVIDQATQQTVGSFGALVSTGRPAALGNYVELVVTSNQGDAQGIPPVGSVLANLKILGQFGWAYSAIPSPAGNVVSLAITTPFGNIPIRFYKFDAAQGIADQTVDNRPIDLGNGFNIAPLDPTGQTFTGTSGFLPLFQTIQTTQTFALRDSSGNVTGTFDAVATTTWDGLGAYTEAVLVTKTYGDNVGTGIGQVPPVGTVYNVGYTGNDSNYVLYSSMPSPSGNVISLIEGSGGEVRNILTFPVNRLDASAPPPVKRLPFAAGYGLLPISELVPFGVNGLPPRDVQIQGYQQFGVYDPNGVQTGSFNAIVTNQWDFLGITSKAIMVTQVTEGTPGSAPGNTPPVGSVLNYVYAGNTGLGTSYWSLPSASGTRTSFKFLTPLINIPTWSRYNASAGLEDVTFVNPFHTV